MILVLGPKTRTRITNSVESVLVDFLNLFMHVFSYVLGGSDTNCNCSGSSSGGDFDNKGN